MKNLSESVLTKLVRVLLIGIIVFSIGVIIFLPYIVDWYLGGVGAPDAYFKNVLLIMLYPSGVFAVLIEWEIFSIFRSLKDNNPFVIKNVKSFKRVAIYLFAIAALFIFKVVKLNTLMTMIGVLAFIVVGLLMLVLSDIFNQAVVYKQDHDLTI